MVYASNDQRFQALLDDVHRVNVPVIREPLALAGFPIDPAGDNSSALVELYMALVWHWTKSSEEFRSKPLSIATARLLELLKWRARGPRFEVWGTQLRDPTRTYAPGWAYEKLDRAIAGLVRSPPDGFSGPIVQGLERKHDVIDQVTWQFTPEFLALMAHPEAPAIDHELILKKLPAGGVRCLARLLLGLRAEQAPPHGAHVWIEGKELLRRLGYSSSNAAPSRIKNRVLPEKSLADLQAAGILRGAYETRPRGRGFDGIRLRGSGALRGDCAVPGVARPRGHVVRGAPELGD